MAVDDAAQGAAGPAAMNPAQPAGAGNSPALTDALKTAITALTHNIAKEDKEKLKEKWYNYTQKKSADAPSQVTFASSLCSVPLAGTFHGD
jgi:DNA-directed RNA polymerase subunit M/transcription elongation factor TFIIS